MRWSCKVPVRTDGRTDGQQNAKTCKTGDSVLFMSSSTNDCTAAEKTPYCAPVRA